MKVALLIPEIKPVGGLGDDLLADPLQGVARRRGDDPPAPCSP